MQGATTILGYYKGVAEALVILFPNIGLDKTKFHSRINKGTKYYAELTNYL